MPLKLWEATYIFVIRYTTGFWFWKRCHTQDFDVTDRRLVFAEEPEYAIEKFKRTKLFKDYSLTEDLEYRFGLSYRDYEVLNLKVVVEEVNYNFEYVKNHMVAQDFIEYVILTKRKLTGNI